MMKKRIVDVIAILFIALFVYTGASKFLDFEYYKLTIEQAAILKPFAGILRWAVPITEILIAVMLLTKKYRLLGLYGSLALMLAFTFYVGGILQFNKELPCSCGGIIDKLNWPQHLVFNIIFTILAFIAIRLEKGSRNAENRTLQTVVSS